MQKLRILVLIPNLGPGGAQAVFQQQLKYLSDHFQVTGCVFNWDGSFQEDKTPMITSLEVSAGTNFIQKAFLFVKRIYRLRKFKRENHIDVSISHLEGADYVNLLSSGSDKTICWVHGTKRYDGNISGFVGLIRQHLFIPLIYRLADKVVTVSHALQNELQSFYRLSPLKLITIYNAFDVAKINMLKDEPIDANHDILFENTVLITHCRLARQKNIEGLLAVFSEIKKQRSDIRLVILGDGELRMELLGVCKAMALSFYSSWGKSGKDDNYDVYFLGHQFNPYTYLARASLYVLASNWEGFPLALCEAMACGTPVIATDCPTGPSEILDPSTSSTSPIRQIRKTEFGCLFPLIEQNNHASLTTWTKGILELLEDKELLRHYSKQGAARISDFDTSKMLELTENLINNVNGRVYA